MGIRRLLRFLLPPFLALVLILTGIRLFRLYRMEQMQIRAYSNYVTLITTLPDVELTILEQGTVVGTYMLDELNLLDPAMEDTLAVYDPISRMSAQEYADLKTREKLRWKPVKDSTITLRGEAADLEPVLEALNKRERYAPQDSRAILSGGKYIIVPEMAGTTLDEANLEGILRQALSRVLKPNGTRRISVELTEFPIYETAAVTKDDSFDYEAILQEKAVDLKIPLQFLDTTKKMDVSSLVSVTEDGHLVLDEDGLSEAVDNLIPKLSPKTYGYMFNSSTQGPVPLTFLPCTYEVDKPALLEQLKKQLRRLDTSVVDVPKLCFRNGELYSMDDTYVEVDIRCQKMTFIKNGEVVMQTDVVTGYPHGRWTPPGLYAVENKSTDDWLYGVDYTVFVEYWVGYDGEYGIHDANWRSVFGGENYLSNGSHGCVNTPTEAMKTIYENIEVGVPVIIFDSIPKK